MSMQKHFTATVYIIKEGKVLLIHHRKFNKWLPPGGHIDENETPTDAACREAEEETGLKIELISQENIWIEHSNAKSLKRPYMCLLEEIPAHGGKPAHQHIDFIYLGRPIGGKEAACHREIGNMGWFTLNEVKALKVDDEIFKETQESIQAILSAK